MEAVRPKKGKSKSSGKPQLSRKQRQAEEAPAAPPAAPPEEALCSGFSDIPLSLPYQGTEGQDPAHSLADTTDVTKDQPSEIPLSSSTALASDPQTLSADTTLAAAETESQIAPKTQQSDDERLVETRGQDLRAETESTKAAETSHQRWIESCLAAKNALGYHGNRGLLSSLVGWISGSATPSFIEGQSLSGELLSPECWRVSLRVLGCLPPPRSAKTTVEPAASSGAAATTVSLSPQQTDLRTFGLYSAWTPYISDVVTFWGHLAGCLVNVQLCACAREPVGSAKVLQAVQTLHSKLVWFAWLVLNMEGLFEEDSQLRRCVEHELLSEPNLSSDQALKKAQQRLKLVVVPSLERLQVYRWAQQALATPPDHPMLPLIWQRFLQLYLRQPGPEYGRVHRQENRPEQVTMSLECRRRGGQPCQGAANITVTCECVQKQEAVQTQIVSLHADVKKLQADAVAPPPQSLAQAAELWLEYVDHERVQFDQREVLSLWEKALSEPTFLHNQNLGLADYSSLHSARERVLSNLQKHAVPGPAPQLQPHTAPLQPHTAPVAEIPSASLTDRKAAIQLLQEDLRVLQGQASVCSGGEESPAGGVGAGSCWRALPLL
ncbi:hypothetical protein CRUP_009204 [Coryphaenoides rupestris]|nr:hypothetical protein CRUP_009204 [Coryphaenoides rupestris]